MRTKYNPERREFRGISYRKNIQIRVLKEKSKIKSDNK